MNYTGMIGLHNEFKLSRTELLNQISDQSLAAVTEIFFNAGIESPTASQTQYIAQLANTLKRSIMGYFDAYLNMQIYSKTKRDGT